VCACVCVRVRVRVAGLNAPFVSYPPQGEEVDEDDAYQILSTLKRITAFHKYDTEPSRLRSYIHTLRRSPKRPSRD